MLRAAFLTVILLLEAPVSANIGFSTIGRVDKNLFSCIASYYSTKFFSGRVWTMYGSYDAYGIPSLKDAVSSGYAIDGEFDPCMESNCPHVANQIEAVVNRMKQEGLALGTLWVKIVNTHNEWSGNTATNQQAIANIISQADKMGQNVGFFADQESWEKITDKGFSGGASKPLWWSNEDQTPNNMDFIPFGGWLMPAVKQYAFALEHRCNGYYNIDLNYKP